jgi:hypothetical protein
MLIQVRDDTKEIHARMLTDAMHASLRVRNTSQPTPSSVNHPLFVCIVPVMTRSTQEIRDYIWGFYGSEEALLRALPACPLEFHHRVYINSGIRDPMLVGDTYIIVSLFSSTKSARLNSYSAMENPAEAAPSQGFLSAFA